MDNFSPNEEYAPLGGYDPGDEYAPIGAPIEPAEPIEPSKAEPAIAEEPAEPVKPVASELEEPAAEPPSSEQPAQPALGQAFPSGPAAQAQPGYPYAYGAYPPFPAAYAPQAQPAPVNTPQQYYPATPQPYSYAQYPQYPQSQQYPPYPQNPQYPQYPQYGQYPAYPPQAPAQPMQQAQPQAPIQPMQQTAPPARPQAQPYTAPAQSPYAPAAQPQYRQQQYQQPFTPKPQPEPNEPKPRTSTGTKVFLIVISALMVAMIVGFCIYVAHVAEKDKGGQNDSGNSINDIYDDFFGGDDNGGNGGLIDNNSVKSFDEEITLIEDKGETQKRDDDKAESSGEPDPDADGIKLQALPNDKKDSKYTTQYAYDTVTDSVVTVELFENEITENIHDVLGAGTGTIISSDGYIITNAHVIGNSRRYAVQIVMNSGDKYQAKVIGYDTWADLALLKIDAKDLTPVTFGDSGLIEIGQDVIAVGSPGGEKFQNSLTKGVVSAVDREISINKYVRYIQSDAAISPGNSGGPLCNVYGQVIGINTAKTTAVNYEAMTFSIPSTIVKETVNELMHYGYVRGRTRIGFSGSEVSEDQVYFGSPAGLLIGEIDENGSLGGTEIKEGDIITAVDGEEVRTFQDIYAILNKHKPGDKIKITVTRAE